MNDDAEHTTQWRARITDRKTGETAITTTLASEYWWTEGNGGCDCNRYIELRQALGEVPDYDSLTCLDRAFPDGRYALDLVPVSAPDERGQTIAESPGTSTPDQASRE